jgi:recombination protein RecR
MSKKTAGAEIERLIALLARLPGLGHRSARKAALSLLKRRVDLLEPLAAALGEAAGQNRGVHQLWQHRYRQSLHDLPGPPA